MTQRGSSYLLPVRFDDSAVPGLDSGWHYLKAEEFTPERLADAVHAQLVELGVREPRTQSIKTHGLTFPVESLSADAEFTVSSDTLAATLPPDLADLLARPASQRPEDIRSAIDFGTSQPVEVPGEQIAVKTEDGARVLDGAHRVILQAPGVAHLAGRPAGLRFYNPDARMTGSFLGRVKHAGLGRLGSALEIGFEEGLDVTICVPFTAGVDGNLTTRLRLDGLSPDSTRRCVGTLLQLHEADAAEVILDGLSLGKVGNFVGSRDPEYLAALRAVHEAADDLAVIQRETGVYFPMPEELEGYERLWMRTIRLMIEGHAAPVPRRVYKGTAYPDIGRAQMLEEGSFALMMPGNEMTLAGHPVPLPPFIVYHPHAVFTGLEESLEDVRLGKDAPRQFEVRPVDETAFVAYFPDLLPRDAVASTPWGVTGVKDPPPTRPVRATD